MDNDEQIAHLEKVAALQPRRGALLLFIPIIAVFAVLGTYVVAFIVAIQGRPADGERVTLAWATCAEARPIVERRVSRMGLGDPVFTDTPDGFTLTVTLPADPDVAAKIPGTLAKPGVLRGTRNDRPDVVVLDNTHVVEANMRQDITLMPWTVLTLTPEGQSALRDYVIEVRDGKVVYTMDGTPVGIVSNLKGANAEVELTPDGDQEVDRMHAAAERMVVLDSGPLPCPLQRKGPS